MSTITEAQRRIQWQHQKSKMKTALRYLILVLTGFIMLYPLIWIIGASFNSTIMQSFFFLPTDFTIQGWVDVLKAPGWGSQEGYSLLRALWNTLQYVIPQVVFMTISTLLVAFAVTRTQFKGKKVVFALIIGTLLMPSTIFTIPMFAFWTSNLISPLWEGSSAPFMPYLPLWAGSLFATNSFSIFMYIQFFRTIPRDLDEAAYMDGANKFQLMVHVLMPILKPIIITVALLLFLSAFHDYQGPLIYRGEVETYPLSLVLQLLGKSSSNTYAHVYTRSIFSVALPIIIFFMAQKYFVGNDADSAIKG